jgi:hypothetical protein
MPWRINNETYVSRKVRTYLLSTSLIKMPIAVQNSKSNDFLYSDGLTFYLFFITFLTEYETKRNCKSY